jgi:serine/threonine-protein kinase
MATTYGTREAGELGVQSSSIRHVPVSFSTIGAYRLGREIGRGAGSVIYEAQHFEQGRKAAIKLLDPNLIGIGKASRQDALFAREALILAKIPHHPGIIGILDAGLAEGLPYIVMEAVEGQPLSIGLRYRKTDLKDLVRILRNVALAVHHAHEHGVLHRNLKPSNVLVDEEGQSYVTDFGSAKKTGPQASLSASLFNGKIGGTPSYMSPEQASARKDVDRRSDVYSLGAILYEMITGRPPFRTGTSLADLVTVINGAITPPSQVVPEGGAQGGDAAIEAICMKALHKDREQRTGTAKAFADALTEWLGEKPVEKPLPKSLVAGACLGAGLTAAASLLYFLLA